MFPEILVWFMCILICCPFHSMFYLEFIELHEHGLNRCASAKRNLSRWLMWYYGYKQTWIEKSTNAFGALTRFFTFALAHSIQYQTLYISMIRKIYYTKKCIFLNTGEHAPASYWQNIVQHFNHRQFWLLCNSTQIKI